MDPPSRGCRNGVTPWSDTKSWLPPVLHGRDLHTALPRASPHLPPLAKKGNQKMLRAEKAMSCGVSSLLPLALLVGRAARQVLSQV